MQWRPVGKAVLMREQMKYCLVNFTTVEVISKVLITISGAQSQCLLINFISNIQKKENLILCDLVYLKIVFLFHSPSTFYWSETDFTAMLWK